MLAMIFKCYSDSPLSSRLKRAGALLIFVFSVLHLTTANSSPYSESNRQKIRISYEENLLSIRVKDADLKEVLFELASKTNIQLKLPLSIDKKITINKSGISLGEGLEYILKNLNHIIFFSGIKNGKPLISNVFVFSTSQESIKSMDSQTQAASRETQLPNLKTQAASSIIQLPSSEMQAADIIKSYEKQIEMMKGKLLTTPENSRLRRRYSMRIKQLEKLIENYNSRQLTK